MGGCFSKFSRKKTSLDWVPVSEYNTRTNYSQTRKQTNNSSDQELTDLDNSVSFESGFGRFVPVRPQPRALPLNVQNRENLTAEQHDDGASSTVSGHTLHPYAHQVQNGLIAHSNHAAAAVMIVNPTTPNAVTGNVSQPFNAISQNRNNLTRNLNPARNNFDGHSHPSNNNTTPQASNSRTRTKTVNLMNNMYDQGQGSFSNVNENNHGHRESARALGEAIVAACPDAAAVERRLSQIREYIRVTSSLVDTMRNSEDEAFIEHTKEEYDELVDMVMTLKESENKLESILIENRPENIEVPTEETEVPVVVVQANAATLEVKNEGTSDMSGNAKNNTDNSTLNNNLKKVTNIENEQLNKSMHNIRLDDDSQSPQETNKPNDTAIVESEQQLSSENLVKIEENNKEVGNASQHEPKIKKDDQHLNDVLRKNILSCVEKVARIEEMKNKKKDSNYEDQVSQEDVASRPVSAHSNGSAYSDNELWQNEIKNKMEMSQMRLAALKQQQKRLLKYQEEAKQQLDEINRERQSQEQQTIQPSTSHDNFAAMQNQSFGNYNHPNRMYAANQIGVATTLPHSSEVMHAQQNMSNNMDQEQETEHGHSHSAHSTRSQEERFSHREANIANGEEAAGGARDSEVDEEEMLLNERGRLLQHKLRELKLKKEHMESLVSEFQKMQLATTLGAYSSSGDDSGNDEPSRKCNKPRGHLNNADPFKLIEIKAIKKALQKTKDLMRTAENYEEDQMGGEHEDSFRETSNHPNIHDNKSEGGGSLGDWSNEGSVWRVRNTLLQRHKFTNEQHSQQCHPQQQLQQQHPQQQQRQQLQQQHPQQQLHQQHPQQQLQQQHLQQQLQQQLHQHPQQHPQQQLQQQQHPQQQLQQQHPQQQSHEANLTSLQELAQELRLETEKIMGERARLNDMISNKEVARKQKKVNEEVRPGPSSCPGPVERRQMQLRALLADKQRELEALLNKEKVISSIAETQKIKPVSRTTSVVDQSYNSEQEEPDSRSEQVLLDSQISRETENYRGGGDSISGTRSIPVLPSHIGSAYGSDSDSASRNKSNQRNRSRRRQMQERLAEDEDIPTQSNNAAQNTRHEPRAEASNVNMVPPTAHNSENAGSMAYSHIQPPPGWTTTKSNQDMRTNQFTQNSHSQTMERLMGTPQMSYPPSMPYNMMMPYGMVGGCGCGCGFWGAWCWQQLVIQQREIHQLRDQLNHLEERWRAETASHTLNNQVPPGNRANNYWDNFRSYSRQNLLSANNKTNADGHLSGGPAHNPHPLVERSHNTLHQTSSTTSPCITPKRNTNAASFSLNAAHTSQTNNEDVPNRQTRQNVSYERSLSFSSAPDLLNVNHNPDADAVTASHSGNIDESTTANVSNININRQETPSNSFRNLNISNPIPEIIQHSNNLNSTANSKKKSSSKLPAKNSTNRRNFTLDYTQTSNINIASTSEAPNPNLASTSRQIQDKATSKLFDLLRENVYSEVTNLIGVNESHPDFLIQLFRELQGISSDNLRQRVLQSIRNVSTPYTSLIDGEGREMIQEETRADPVSTTSTEHSNYNDCNSVATQNVSGNRIEIDNKVMRFLILNSDEICSIEFLDVLATNIISSTTGDLGRFKHSRRRINDFLAKYEGMRVCEVSSDILDNLPMLISTSETDSGHLLNVLPESTIMQDVAGSLNLFSSSDSELHQMNACDDIDLWPDHDPMDMEPSDLNDNRPESTDGKVDLLNCLEMHNGDLAEADQTRRPNMSDSNLNDHDDVGAAALPDAHDTEDVTPTEAEAEWLGLDRVPTRLHMEEASEKQKD